MADIAELGFAVNTAGLKEGSAELDKLNKTAKQTEDQAKRTGDALGKSGDGAKKLGQDSKAAGDGMQGMSEQAKKVATALDQQITKMQLTAAEYRVLQNLQKAGTTLDSDAGKAIAARTLALEAGLAGTQRAAVSNGVLGQSLQALFPQMTALTTATRAVAIEKEALAITSANLAGGLNVLRPAIVAAGGAMGTLPAAAAAARFGLIGVGLAAAGGAAVGLARFADGVGDARGRLGALLGSGEASRKVLDELRASSERGGAGLDVLARSTEDVVRGLGRVELPPGVYQLGAQAQLSAQKVTAAFVEINRVIAGLHIPEGSFKPGLDALTKGLADAKNQGKLTADTFREIQNVSPELARALASAFNQSNLENFRRSLEQTPRTIDQITSAMKNLDLAKVEGLDPKRAETFAEALNKVDRSWKGLLQSVTDAGGFSFMSNSLDEVSAGIGGLSRLIDSIRNKSIKFDFGFSDDAKRAFDSVNKAIDDYDRKSRTLAQTAKEDAATEALYKEAIDGVNDSLRVIDDTMALASRNFDGLADSTTKAGEAGATFAQGFGNSMEGAAASAEASSQRIISAMQQIADAANAASAAAAGASAGGDFGGVGSAPYAMGGAFAGGVEITPFARGTVISRPTLFPMANGMGLMGEAGPEAVMPLKRGPDGRLGVTASGGGFAGPDIESIIRDQTTELRNSTSDAADMITSKIGTSADKIIAAINAGNIRVGSAASTQATATKAFDGAVVGFDGAVAGFSQAVSAVSTSAGGYTSSQSFSGGGSFGANVGAPGTRFGGPGLNMKTSAVKSTVAGGSGTNMLNGSESMFAGSGGGGSAGGGGFTPYMAPNGQMVNNRADALDRYNGVGKYANIGSGSEANPGGYAGQYLGAIQGGGAFGGAYPQQRSAAGGSGYSTSQGGAPDLSTYNAGAAGGMSQYYAYGQSMGTYYANPYADTGGADYYTSGGGAWSGSGGYSTDYSKAYTDYGYYADGGSFTVAGSGGTDSQLVGMHLTPGERVTVDSGDGMSGGTGGSTINLGGIHLHGVKDKAGMLESIPQFEAAIMRAVQRAMDQR